MKRSAYYDGRAMPNKVLSVDELAVRRHTKALFIASRVSLGTRMLWKSLCQEDF